MVTIVNKTTFKTKLTSTLLQAGNLGMGREKIIEGKKKTALE